MSWREMAESIADDCIDAFAEDVEFLLYNKATDSHVPITVRAVFSSNYDQINLDGNAISSQSPMVEVSIRKLSQMPTKRDKVRARGILYQVREVGPNADGAVKVYLTR